MMGLIFLQHEFSMEVGAFEGSITAFFALKTLHKIAVVQSRFKNSWYSCSQNSRNSTHISLSKWGGGVHLLPKK